MYITKSELDEKDDEGCKSCEDNGNGLMINEDEMMIIYFRIALHCIAYVGIEVTTYHYSALWSLPFGYILF